MGKRCRTLNSDTAHQEWEEGSLEASTQSEHDSIPDRGHELLSIQFCQFCTVLSWLLDMLLNAAELFIQWNSRRELKLDFSELRLDNLGLERPELRLLLPELGLLLPELGLLLPSLSEHEGARSDPSNEDIKISNTNSCSRELPSVLELDRRDGTIQWPILIQRGERKRYFYDQWERDRYWNERALSK